MRSIKRSAKAREIREARTGNALSAIGEISPGMETFCLTYGQFSLIDALVVLLAQTGPADVVLSTWTAASMDLTQMAEQMRDDNIRRLRMIVDRSFVTLKPEYCEKMRRLYGDACIRTTRTHAKFMTIRNDEWTLAIRTSMNLNFNPRIENIEISDDAELCTFLETVADELFAAQEAGTFDGELVAAPPTAGVRMGRMAAALKNPHIGPRT
jgi:hypothetical protein